MVRSGRPKAGAGEGSLYGEVTNDIVGNGHVVIPTTPPRH